MPTNDDTSTKPASDDLRASFSPLREEVTAIDFEQYRAHLHKMVDQAIDLSVEFNEAALTSIRFKNPLGLRLVAGLEFEVEEDDEED